MDSRMDVSDSDIYESLDIPGAFEPVPKRKRSYSDFGDSSEQQESAEQSKKIHGIEPDHSNCSHTISDEGTSFSITRGISTIANLLGWYGKEGYIAERSNSPSKDMSSNDENSKKPCASDQKTATSNGDVQNVRTLHIPTRPRDSTHRAATISTPPSTPKLTASYMSTPPKTPITTALSTSFSPPENPYMFENTFHASREPSPKKIRTSFEEDAGRVAQDIHLIPPTKEARYSRLGLQAWINKLLAPTILASGQSMGQASKVDQSPVPGNPSDSTLVSERQDHSIPARSRGRLFENQRPIRTMAVKSSKTSGLSIDEELSSLMSHGINHLTLSDSGREYQARLKKESDRKLYEREQLRIRQSEEKARREAESLAKALLAEGKRRATSIPFVRPLDKAMDSLVEDALAKGAGDVLTESKDGPFRVSDMMTVLGSQSWLNDMVISRYLSLIVEHGNRNASTKTTPKIVTFNSFFYKNLSSKGYPGVARWSKRLKIDGKRLLEAETILIPVNNANHWTLLVVSPKRRTVEYLDSFHGSPHKFVQHCMVWLAGELGKAFVEDEWRVLETGSAHQTNGYDCGVFLLSNAECVMAGIDTETSYSGKDMAAQRRRIAAVILNNGFGTTAGWD